LTTSNIGYNAYAAINALLRAHQEEHHGHLRAAIVFGDLVVTGGSPDIEIVEVVADWHGPRHAAFLSTAALPLRGQLHLYFLKPEEFEGPQRAVLTGESWSSADLMERVRQGYAVLYEQPSGYAVRVMAKLEGRLFVAQPESEDSQEDPITFLKNLRERQPAA
jgi:hypothetical protein